MTLTGEDVLRLAHWFSPAFPTGAFAYSHGLEAAIARGDVRDRASLESWIELVLSSGSGKTDAVLFSLSFCALDAEKRQHLSDLAIALSAGRERDIELVELGGSFSAALAHEGVVSPDICDAGWAYPVVAGAASSAFPVECELALGLFLQAFVANLVSVAQRLVPIGQSDGVKAMATLRPQVAKLAAAATSLTEEDIGSASLGADLASLNHETLHTRIFRT